MHRLIVALLLLALGSHGLAQPADAASVTEVEVLEYKRGVDAGCKGLAGPRPVAPERVRVCECIMKALESSLSGDEWRQAAFFSRKRDEREMDILKPHMATARLCRNAP